MLTVYDENGNYGHPDHIQVHRVGVRAAELAGTRRVYEATANRDHIRRLMEQMPQDPDAPESPADLDTLGVTEDQITTTVDVRDFVDQQARRDGRAREPDPRRLVLLAAPARRVPRGVRLGVVHPRATVPRTQRETSLFDEPRLTGSTDQGRPTQYGRTRVTVLENAFVTQKSEPSNASASENEFSGSARVRIAVADSRVDLRHRALVGVGDPDEPSVEHDAVRAGSGREAPPSRSTVADTGSIFDTVLVP